MGLGHPALRPKGQSSQLSMPLAGFGGLIEHRTYIDRGKIGLPRPGNLNQVGRTPEDRNVRAIWRMRPPSKP
ncbi:hypothetical protein BJP26_18520 [Sphingomonas melonis TY]|jgi:hypothetical protein|nr:hypothetical protein BJP26_18520 [Sphingomonas melonis TY]